MSQNTGIKQHTAGRSLFLHLLPGVLIGIFYFPLIQPFRKWGYPSMMPLMVAVMVILVPFELGLLFYQGYKKNGRLSLQGVVNYWERIPFWQYLLWIPILFVLIGLIFTLLKPVDVFLQNSFFSWMPVLDGGLTEEFSKSSLIFTYLMAAIFGAVIGPAVEELYFRGYLLPRMEYAGKWASILHSFLFAIYHVFTPWMLVTRTIGMLPLIYVAKKRSLLISIIVHILLNLVDIVAGVSFILALSGD